MKLLHVDSSILGGNSVSRRLSAAIVAQQQALHPGLEVITRDLAADAPLHLSGAHLAAWQGAAPENPQIAGDIARDATLMDELFAADIIVIGAPMYNFSIPTQLKAWIDRLLVAGKTFRYTEKGPEGLVKGKKAFVASSRGGKYTGTSIEFLDHQETYLKVALGFIGITDATVIRAEGVAIGADAREAAIDGAQNAIAEFAA